MTVRELLARMDSAELSEWMAYLSLEMERNKPDQPTDETDIWKKAFNCG